MEEQQWTFPHSTCERVFDGALIAQPYSFAVTLVAAALLLRAAFRAPTPWSCAAIASFALFETVHCLSHAIHLDNPFYHELAAHACSYLMAWTTRRALLADAGYRGDAWASPMVLAATVALDLAVFATMRGVGSIFTGLLVLVVVVAQARLSLGKKTVASALALGAAAVVLFLHIEAIHCDYARDTWGIDLHPWLVEVPGLVLFQGLARLVVQ